MIWTLLIITALGQNCANTEKIVFDNEESCMQAVESIKKTHQYTALIDPIRLICIKGGK